MAVGQHEIDDRCGGNPNEKAHGTDGLHAEEPGLEAAMEPEGEVECLASIALAERGKWGEPEPTEAEDFQQEKAGPIGEAVEHELQNGLKNSPDKFFDQGGHGSKLARDVAFARREKAQIIRRLRCF